MSIADAKAALADAQQKLVLCEAAIVKLRGETFESSDSYKNIQTRLDRARADREKIQLWKTTQIGNLNREYETDLAKLGK